MEPLLGVVVFGNHHPVRAQADKLGDGGEGIVNEVLGVEALEM